MRNDGLQMAHWNTPSFVRDLCLLVVVGAVLASPASASNLRFTAIVRAVAQARPSIVNIHGRKTVRSGEKVRRGDDIRQVNGMGTGIVIDSRGYIITNYHVVEGVSRIQVTLADKRTVIAHLVNHDVNSDLAVIKISVSEKLPIIRIGTSRDLMPGEPVVAVGNAYGYEHTVTRGIISALNRTVQVSDNQKYKKLIQTDASINPGNSGGPLLNIDGNMIGINVAVRVGAQGIGFAIPIDEAMVIAGRLMSAEHLANLTHGILGKGTYSSDGKLQFVVELVDKATPAGRAGLESNDVIRSVGAFPIKRRLDIERALLGRSVGEEIPIKIERGSESQTVSLVIAGGSRRQALTDRVWRRIGLRVTPVDKRTIRRINPRYNGGLRVDQVRAGSPAAEQGIRRGDLLVGMHKWETVSLDNMAYILKNEEFNGAPRVKFFLLRGRETRYGYLESK